MPTARELLEQADALMRRNRLRPDEGEVRPSTEVSAVSAAGPTTRDAAEGPAGSVDSRPVEAARPLQVASDSETPLIAGMAVIPGVAALAGSSALPDIPELTDVIAEPALGEEAALASLDVAARAGIVAQTDAAALVAETDAASEPVAIAAEGEPSVWLDEASLGEASVTGPAPDSVLVVEPATPDTAVDGFADEPIPEAVVKMFAEAPTVEPATKMFAETRTSQAAVDIFADEPISHATADVFADEPTSQVSADAFSGEPIALAPGRMDSAVRESSPPALAELPPLTLVFDEIVTPANDAAMPRASEAPSSLEGESPGVTESAASTSQGAATDQVQGTRHDDDMARWEALAEEIRMQVLQRIDIFTDTGLKAQLDERLKPVVDRASAELVGTVSQHVGQLLRAYVAEAIEREIDKWRRDGG